MMYFKSEAIVCALKTIAFILIVSCVTAAQIPDARTDREREGYKGLVKRVDVSEDYVTSEVPNEFGVYEISPIRVAMYWEEYDLQGKQISYGPLCGMSSLTDGPSLRKFDKDRNLLMRIEHDRQGRVTSKIYWQYDTHGREIFFYTTDAKDQLKYKWTYEYDDDGQLVVSSLYRPTGLEKRNVFSYNAEGDVSEYTQYDGNGSMAKKESDQYEYDKNKNWIKRIESEWTITAEKSYFKPLRIQHRKITYFD